MSEPDASTALSGDTAHADAAEAFVKRARSRFGERIGELYLFGSTAQGDAHGLASDIDVLVVLDAPEREATADGLRELAYDVMLEYGPVVELHILSAETFERYERGGDPFIENVVSEGRSYV
ncbi:nucleotidyltransferase domain-containing protein [Halosimplex sp. TS25]|uniref:nucleotidyltransferase domain-containing protein n=1 Tax=Halosimplex rarum TaxID=3396619 RepID=UPI0039EA30EA